MGVISAVRAIDFCKQFNFVSGGKYIQYLHPSRAGFLNFIISWISNIETKSGKRPKMNRYSKIRLSLGGNVH